MPSARVPYCDHALSISNSLATNYDEIWNIVGEFAPAATMGVALIGTACRAKQFSWHWLTWRRQRVKFCSWTPFSFRIRRNKLAFQRYLTQLFWHIYYPCFSNTITPQSNSFTTRDIPLAVYRHVAQIPQCTGSISHNVPFCNRNVHVCTFLLQNYAFWDSVIRVFWREFGTSFIVL